LDNKYQEGSPEPGTGKDSISSPEPTGLSTLVSPFGPLNENASRKTFFYLLSTLNAAFPDYEFSDVKPEAFSKLPGANLAKARVMNRIAQFAQQIWSAIDETIQIEESDVYEFRPEDEGSDPYGEDATFWTFHFFFYNRKLKRIVFFTACALSPIAKIADQSEPDLDGIDSVQDDASTFSTPPDSPPSAQSTHRPVRLREKSTPNTTPTARRFESDASTEERPRKLGRFNA